MSGTPVQPPCRVHCFKAPTVTTTATTLKLPSQLHLQARATFYQKWQTQGPECRPRMQTQLHETELFSSQSSSENWRKLHQSAYLSYSLPLAARGASLLISCTVGLVFPCVTRESLSSAWPHPHSSPREDEAPASYLPDGLQIKQG